MFCWKGLFFNVLFYVYVSIREGFFNGKMADFSVPTILLLVRSHGYRLVVLLGVWEFHNFITLCGKIPLELALPSEHTWLIIVLKPILSGYYHNRFDNCYSVCFFFFENLNELTRPIYCSEVGIKSNHNNE